MKALVGFSSLSIALLALSSSAFADTADGSRHGLVTSASCPYSCSDAGLTADVCRESRIGDTCRVEDLTQTPGHRTLVRVPRTSVAEQIKTIGLAADPSKHGLVTSASCPYNCKDAGISPEFCRESQVGDTCRVEDLTQAPGHRTLVRTN